MHSYFSNKRTLFTTATVFLAGIMTLSACSNSNTLQDNTLEATDASNKSSVAVNSLEETEEKELTVEEQERQDFQQKFYDEAQSFLKTAESNGSYVYLETPYFSYNYQIEPSEQKSLVRVYMASDPETPIRQLYCERENDEQTCWVKNTLLPVPDSWYLLDENPVIVTEWLPSNEETETLGDWLLANAIKISNCNAENSTVSYDKETSTYNVLATTAPPAESETDVSTEQATELVFSSTEFNVLSESSHPAAPEKLLNLKMDMMIPVSGTTFDTSIYPSAEEKDKATLLELEKLTSLEQEQNDQAIANAPMFTSGKATRTEPTPAASPSVSAEE